MEQNNLDALKKRGFLALEDGEWERANEFFESALNQNAEDAECYIGKLMAKKHIHKRDEVQTCKTPFDDDPDYKKALRFDSSVEDEFRAALDVICKRVQNENDEKRKKAKAASQKAIIGTICFAAFVVLLVFIVKLARRCPECKGAGTVVCSVCDSGEIKCKVCKNGMVPCEKCSDSNGKSIGTVPCNHCSKEGFPYCDKCEGKGKIVTGTETCIICHGSGFDRKSGCSVCHGKGYYTLAFGTEHRCTFCDGTGREKIGCRLCGASGKIEIEEPCPDCDGSGVLKDRKCSYCKGRRAQTCSECNGKKEVACSACGGTAKVECSRCKGAASIECPQCHETGKKAKKS